MICDEVVREGVLICDMCRLHLSPVKGKRCVKCSKILEDLDNEICLDCRKTLQYFEYGIALFDYKDLKKSLYRYKYNGRGEYADFYANEICKYLGAEICKMKIDMIIPVPLHKNREMKRGYNQAKLIADRVGERLGLQVGDNIVKRVKNTIAQKKLGIANRQNNLKKAFHISGYDVKLKRVLIIDDIYTTGATINSLARELSLAGASEIYFIALAIGRESF